MTRVISCLDVKDQQVVKGIRFSGLKTLGNPVSLASQYEQDGVDELVFLDVSATIEARAALLETVKKTAEEVFVPLTVGGGIRTREDADRLLRNGADKISINSGALANPKVIFDIAQRYGSQCIVVSLDVLRSEGRDCPSGYEVTTHSGMKKTGIDAIVWAQQCQKLGAGEILFNTIDTDGTRQGYDCVAIQRLRENVTIPIIASGGAGKESDFFAAIVAGADAVLAASLFHMNILTITTVKKFLTEQGILVRR